MNTSLRCLPQTDDIAALVDQITSTFLDEPALPVAPTAARESDDIWSGCVTVDGPFRGAVIVACPRDFAIRVGGKMFDTPPGSVSEEDVREALAEFTNVVGGNIKSLISAAVGETCRMGLPVVTNGKVRVAGEIGRREVLFECAHAFISVRVLEVRRSRDSLMAAAMKR
ncbi:MAG: chemotaxis protein CheX [Polyangiales bacterium]